MKFPNKLYLLALVALLTSSLGFASQFEGAEPRPDHEQLVALFTRMQQIEQAGHPAGTKIIENGYVYSINERGECSVRRLNDTDLKADEVGANFIA